MLGLTDVARNMFRVQWRSVTGMAVLTMLSTVRASGQVSALHGLTFGTVIAGTSTSVSLSDPNAAQFRIRGILIVTTSISLTLPTSLTKVGGGATMPISFCSSCAAWNLGTASATGATTYNPNNALSGLIISVLSDIYLFVGGTVTPPSNQAPGSYTGTITLNVAHLL